MKRLAESRKLQAKADVMRVLGGISGLSDLTGSSYKATENWSRARTFPARYHALMSWALRRKGYTAHPSLWGQVTTAEMEKAAA
ncbi:hypothetical protein [Bradyrhizobium sp. 192]|uniref:hypothetical protein n=1 Tax=Bradyrhizobium sp. 192 TaxID=2782660 RepID=UPI0020000B4C|nr:hypothetical protein [Bradyrhizobium sp. 192]UPJ55439.1 hypothetical protein IVB24_22540 [Bradyrhizobium sp. 192]